MNRKEVIELLLAEFPKVPNREVCQVATENEIERIAEELNFDEVSRFLNNKKTLNLTVAEVPKEMHFEMILYFILMTEYYAEYDEYNKYQIWNYDDADTLKFIQNVGLILGGMKSLILFLHI